MKIKSFQWFLLLMVFGGGFYILKMRFITNIHFLETNDFSPIKEQIGIYKHHPDLVEANFTFRLNGVRNKVPYPFNKSLLQLYRVALNADERNLFYFSLVTFANTLYKANITFMLYGGSMLGSRRHHGFIPWDDDIDVWINGTEKLAVRNLLSSVKGFSLHSPVNFQWKFFYTNLKTLKKNNFRWPYIDIFFFRENASHVWEEQKVHRSKYYKRSKIFPLIFRPFDKFRMPTPCAIEEFVGKKAIEKCQTTNFIHRTESYLPRTFQRTVFCDKLYNDYPFVFKSKLNETFSIEELKRGNKVISKYISPSDSCKN